MNLGLDNQLDPTDVTELRAEDMQEAADILLTYEYDDEDKRTRMHRVAKIVSAMANSFAQAQTEHEKMYAEGKHPSQQGGQQAPSIGGMPLKGT